MRCQLYYGLDITNDIKELIRKAFRTPWKVVVKYLGVKITSDLEAMSLIDVNLSPIINEAQKQLENWQRFGKILVWQNSSHKNEDITTIYLFIQEPGSTSTNEDIEYDTKYVSNYIYILLFY